MDRACIVASGPSARGFKPPEGCAVIAVNGAISWLQRVTHWFTLDVSGINLLRMARALDGVEYHAGVYPSLTKTLPAHVKQWPLVRGGTRNEPASKGAEWWLWRWSCKLGISEDGISTGNSAYGALQLAHKLGASRCLLVGVDASQEERIEGGFPNNLSHLPTLFNSMVGAIDFVNCGRMECNAPSMTIEEGKRWLMY